eukprot:CAMPEP_0117666380 /NCGR_PEP_ID=MMETSP0804-20121206/10345_1 /TAXON_ID=1074897 /ORGANISM="Tetraselmis astigmatica, Strain CCMP880" /LENGTH=713 /DNA_ID=CAMNT_0005473921 /DNA_START=66 /DNA_END=2207 /DNA_ORIENTATION=+
MEPSGGSATGNASAAAEIELEPGCSDLAVNAEAAAECGTTSGDKDEEGNKGRSMSFIGDKHHHPVKLHEYLCWRNLEGRCCFPAESRCVAADSPLVIVSIPPSKHSTKGCSSCASSSLDERQATWAAESVRVQEAVLQVQALLVEAGLQPLVDSDNRKTPGSKFCHWEAEGLLLRVELGIMEAVSETACLWVHPALPELLQEARISVLELCTLELRQVGQRLPGIPASALPQVCQRLITCISLRFPKGSIYGAPETPDVVDHASQRPASCPSGHAQLVFIPPPSGPPPSPLCQKLHLLEPSSSGSGARDLCVAHLRFLAGVGKPCHCVAREHITSPELVALAEASYNASTGGNVQHWFNPARSTADSASHGSGGEPVATVVANLPSSCSAAGLTAKLTEVFSGFNMLRVHGSKTKGCFRHGWVRVYVRSMEDARRAVSALDGTLEHDGHRLTVSMSAGRLDTLFPLFPFALRSALRVDSVGAFSVTDQVTADRVTDIIAAAAEEVLLAGRHGIRASAGEGANHLLGTSSYRETEATLAAGLLPLTVTDATACSGGNTLSLMRRFARLLSVELDEDRVMDLRRNVDAVLQFLKQEQERSPGRDSKDVPVLAAVTTYHDDYLNLAASLEQDVVFLDPPWGGPGYVRSSTVTPESSGDCLQDLFLGEAPVSSLCRGLLAGGRSAIVALRLPSRLPVDAFMRSVATTTTSTGREHQP